MSTAEAEIKPDGSATFTASSTAGDTSGGSEEAYSEDTFTNSTFAEGEAAQAEKPTDPAIYLGIMVLVVGVIFILYQLYLRRKKKQFAELEFFSEMDGDKFDLKLPAAVDEYYAIKEKCLEQGWKPGVPPANAQEAQNGPHKVLAQALMKRCISDIPLVQHIQKESTGMNKLYAQSMCSVKQWRMYQAAESMVSTEVEEVRAEADEIEPGWSQMIWRQAMQYHGMLKQKHEAEARALTEAAEKKRAEEEKKNAPEPPKPQTPEEKAAAAERAAQELIKEEEREKQKKNRHARDHAGG